MFGAMQISLQMMQKSLAIKTTSICLFIHGYIHACINIKIISNKITEYHLGDISSKLNHTCTNYTELDTHQYQEDNFLL